METKPRILYLKKILEERTDEEHPLSTTQLINILADEYGISAHRTTVTKDIAALQEFGMDIVTIHSTQSKYFVASRKLELPELKLLIDAVESSKFITKKKSKVINFRVDRIASKPEILDKDIIPVPDDFDIENYTKEVFFMFSGEKVLVDLRCDNSLMKTMVDRFGEDVTTLAYDMTSFRVQTEVSASPTFFGWVFGFNGKVQILAPESVKEQYRQMIAQADEDMQQKENKEQEI